MPRTGSGGAAVAAAPAAPVGVRTSGFRRLLGSWSASLAGDGVRIAALPLYTAVSTRSPLAVSAVAAAEVLPWLLVALPAGALVDRWNARRVVLVAHLLRSGAMAALAVAVATGHATVPVLVVAAFAVTAGETFADPASQRLLVDRAGDADLEKANGWLVSVETGALDVAGPIVAGLLFLWQPAACFAVDALSFVAAAWLVLGVPAETPERRAGAGESAGRPATRGPDDAAEPARQAGNGRWRVLAGEVAEGGRFLLRSPGLRTLVAAVVVAALCAAAANAVMALYAIQVLGIPQAAVPTLWVAMGLGTLLAARVVPPLTARVRDGWVMVAALALLAAGFGLLGALRWAPVGWLGYALVGIGSGGWNVLSATRRQRFTPAPMMGRVTSSYRLLAWGLMPIGAGLAGPVAELTSLGTVYLLAAGLLVLVIAVLAGPLVRNSATPHVPADRAGET
jgi:MFS family permease